MKKGYKILIGIILLLIIVIIIAIVQRSPLEKELIKKGHVYILFLGVDSVNNLSRSDTIMLIDLNKNGHVRMLAIPRDTRVNYLGSNIKINTVFARGYVKGGYREGERRLQNTIEKLFKINILRYVILDYNTFEKIIDLIGGVDVYISKDMYYIDKNGGLLIDLSKGVHHLDGKRSLEFIRFRHDGLGDLGRLQREKDFIHSFLNAKNMKKILTNKKVLERLMKMLKNNFQIKELFYLKKNFSHINLNSIDMAVLQGEPKKINKGYYYIVKNFDFNSNFSKINDNNKKNKRLIVKILNGNGKKGLGEKVAEILRQLGYDVVAIENADNFNYQKSVLFNYTGNKESVTKIIKKFHIQLVYDREKRSIYDIEFIIGHDIKGN